jgi:glycosyltransferase involved in cell wall biosynthesis
MRRSIVLFVVNVPEFFLSHRLPIALGAIAAGYDVHVATAAGPAQAKLAELGITPHTIRIKRIGTNPVAEIAAFLDMVGILRRIRPDILHLVTIKPVIYGGVAARLVGSPAVISAISGLGYVFERDNLKASILRTVLRPLYRLALRRRNGVVIFQNEHDRAALIKLAGIDPRQARLIKGSGVDFSHFPDVEEPPPPLTAVFAARLLWTKGVGEFAEAATLVRREIKGARFLIAGASDPGNPKALTPADVELMKRHPDVTMLGHIENIPALLAQAHVVAYPSYYGEGVPKVLLEAAAAGRPIVTTDHPGCRDAIDSGSSGLLVPVRDAQALAQAILELFRSPDLRRNMGAAARQKALSEFSVQSVVAQHLAIYRDIEPQPKPVAAAQPH